MQAMMSDAISFCGIAEDGTRLEGYFDGPMASRKLEWVSLPLGRLCTNSFYYFDTSSTDAEPDTTTPSGTPSSTASIASIGQTKELDSAAEVPTVHMIDSS